MSERRGSLYLWSREDVLTLPVALRSAWLLLLALSWSPERSPLPTKLPCTVSNGLGSAILCLIESLGLEKTIKSNCQHSTTTMFTPKLCPQMPHPQVFWREKGQRLLKVLPPFSLLTDLVPLRERGCCFLWKEQDCVPRRQKRHQNQHRQLSQFNLVPSASEGFC